MQIELLNTKEKAEMGANTSLSLANFGQERLLK